MCSSIVAQPSNLLVRPRLPAGVLEQGFATLRHTQTQGSNLVRLRRNQVRVRALTSIEPDSAQPNQIRAVRRLSEAAGALPKRKTKALLLQGFRKAAGLGLEPRLPDPESGVLPLDDPARGGHCSRVSKKRSAPARVRWSGGGGRQRSRFGSELADQRKLLRVVQLRSDLPVSPHRRRFRTPLHARGLRGRPLVTDRRGRCRRHRSLEQHGRARNPLRRRRAGLALELDPLPRVPGDRRAARSTRGDLQRAPRRRSTRTSRGRGGRASSSRSDPSRSRSITRGGGNGCASAIRSASGSAIGTAAAKP